MFATATTCSQISASNSVLQTTRKITTIQCKKTSLHLVQKNRTHTVRATIDSEDNEDAQLLEDQLKEVERFKQTQQQQFSSFYDGVQQKQEDLSPFQSVKNIVDSILIADFFFIIFTLAWLGGGLVLQKGMPGILDTWLKLWPWVFQPAIGVLMLGALMSGLVGWAKENIFESKN